MCVKFGFFLFSILLVLNILSEAEGDLSSMLDFRYFRCVMKREWDCPDSEINFFFYSPDRHTRTYIDPRYPELLNRVGWNLTRKNVLIIHGFNGTHNKTPMTFIRDAYLSRKDYNVFTVDWSVLSRFPCYLSSLSNMKKAAQCTAQLYSTITRAGALAKEITCVGHSLGAHICGMMSNHLTEKQYKIVGLDPGRPLVSAYGSKLFRLGREDAHVVQVIHTNAGYLGVSGLVGHADFCINGGRTQPGCKGHPMRIARCSHFMSSCYFAASVRKSKRLVGIPCDSACPKEEGQWNLRLDKKAVVLGADVPDGSGATGLRRPHTSLSSQMVVRPTTAALACWPALPTSLSRGSGIYIQLLLSLWAASPLRACGCAGLNNTLGYGKQDHVKSDLQRFISVTNFNF